MQKDRREGARFARNALSSYGARGLYALTLLVLTPYLYVRLGAPGFGTWSVMFTFTMIFTLVFTGFAAGLTKVLADQHAAGSRDAFAASLGGSVLILGVLGIAAAVVSLLAGVLLPGLAAEGYGHDFTVGMVVLGVSMLVVFPTWAYAAALQSVQRYDLYSAGGVVSSVAFTAGAVLAVETGAGVVGVAIAYGGSLVLGGLVMGWLLRRAQRVVLLPPRGSVEAAKGMWRFGSLVLLADSMTFIGQRMDTVVIAAVRGAVQAAPYAAAVRLQSGLQSFTLPLIDLLLPMVADLRTRGFHDEVRRRFGLATRVALQITLPLAFGIAVFAHDAVDAWLGSGAPAVTASIVSVLMVVQTVGLTTAPAEKVLIAFGRARTIARLAVFEGVANVALSIVLVFRYGAIGAALGSLGTSALIAPAKLPLACRATGLGIRPLLRGGVLVPILSSVPALAWMTAVLLVMEPGALRLAAGLSVGLALAAAVGVAQVGPSNVAGALRSLRRGERLDEIAPGAPGEPAPPAAALPEAVPAFAADERHDVARRRVTELARQLTRQREAGGVDPGLEASLRRARRDLDAARADGARLREGLVGADGLDLALSWLRAGPEPDALRTTMNLAAMSPGRRERSRLRRLPAGDRRPVERTLVPVRAARGPWLSRSIGRLAQQDADAAGALLLGLLPDAARTLDGELVYDIDLQGLGVHRVTLRDGAGSVAAVADGRRDGAAFGVAGSVATLAPLGAGSAPRRLAQVRTWGSQTAMVRLVEARRPPVALSDLAAAGPVPDPALLLRTVAASVEPRWIGRHGFAVVVDCPDRDPITIVAEPGSGMHVAGAPPAGGDVRAVIGATPSALLALVGGAPAPEGDDAWMTGEEEAVRRLLRLLDRAQGVPEGAAPGG